MYLEACFALTAVCLPSLSGGFKLKGVQTLIAGFSAVFSSRSRTTSARSKDNRTHERLDSEVSKQPLSEQGSQTDIDLEMYPVSQDNIVVSKTIKQTYNG